MDAEHLIRFRSQSCVFKFIQHSVDKARDRDRQRQTDRQTETERDRDTDWEGDRQRQTDRDCVYASIICLLNNWSYYVLKKLLFLDRWSKSCACHAVTKTVVYSKQNTWGCLSRYSDVPTLVGLCTCMFAWLCVWLSERSRVRVCVEFLLCVWERGSTYYTILRLCVFRCERGGGGGGGGVERERKRERFTEKSKF